MKVPVSYGVTGQNRPDKAKGQPYEYWATVLPEELRSE